MAATDTATLAQEYAQLTLRCGIVDRSERGKLALVGSGAVEFLNGQVTNELVGLKPGEGRYAAFLTHKGKMLGDLRILAASDSQPSRSEIAEPREASSESSGPRRASDHLAEVPGELLLDTERCALQALFDMIRRFKVGYDVELHKRTLESSLLSLVGPGADALATKTFAFEEGQLPASEHSHRLAVHAQTPIRLVRTDIGVDLLFDADALETVRDALEAAGAPPVSQAAAEIVRVENGRPRYGVDLDESTIPQEAALNERAVSFTKGCYVGQETVARLYYKGKPNRHLRGLLLSESTEPGALLTLGERQLGRLGSSVLSPRFGPIGLALVRREAEPGASLAVGDGGATAVVVELPFQ